MSQAAPQAKAEIRIRFKCVPAGTRDQLVLVA